MFDRTPTGLHGIRVTSSTAKHVPRYHTRGRGDCHQASPSPLPLVSSSIVPVRIRALVRCSPLLILLSGVLGRRRRLQVIVLLPLGEHSVSDEISQTPTRFGVWWHGTQGLRQLSNLAARSAKTNRLVAIWPACIRARRDTPPSTLTPMPPLPPSTHR